MENNNSVDVLILGFGLTAIPLIRELENSGVQYTVISEGPTLWEELERNQRLDFDLVSSTHTSLYSFELARNEYGASYPTAKEFADFQKIYRGQYQHKVIQDTVTRIDNFSDHSLVHTKSGVTYRTRHLVISTAFKRMLRKTINQFDYSSASNKTILVTTTGDSANLMMAKLIPRNNRIILATNGFSALDKFIIWRKTTFTLDQLEYHNLSKLSRHFYRMTIMGGVNVAMLLPSWITRWLFPNNLRTKHPLTRPTHPMALDAKAAIPNGLIAIKYWPIDTFKKLFDNKDLEENIKKGFLLNDIAYFIDKKIIELWPKKQVQIDREKQEATWNDKTIKYDHLIEGDYETPNLPPIHVGGSSDQQSIYSYAYRRNYFGVIPKDLKNIYLLGYTRPTTGGLVNISEMQCLLIHRMITDSDFNNQIYSEIESRLRDYNKRYYGASKPGVTDHLVFYGFYNEDIAQTLGIAPSLKKCRSLKDVAMYYLYPNNILKYRQEGRYKVEGAKEAVEKIWQGQGSFTTLTHYLLNFILLQVCAIVTILMLPLPLYVTVPLAYFQAYNPLMSLVHGNGTFIHDWLNGILLSGLLLTLVIPTVWVPALTLMVTLAFIYVGRRLGHSRVIFNDLQVSQSEEMDAFFRRYCIAYNNAIH